MQNCLAKLRNVAIFAKDIYTSCKNYKVSLKPMTTRTAKKCNCWLALVVNSLLIIKFNGNTAHINTERQKGHSLRKRACKII